MSRRVKMTEDILQMMENTEQIRNIGLIGHIDHGKTTLSDSLLAEAGLLSESLAGEARVLDYLEEEQRRGITMKSANISLYYEHALKSEKPYLINLVDTPGHLDFSGKVTRALRLIDGVVVIVDAVEEISSQTETVVRQALGEAVKPLLFINKIDRLFNELKLDMDQIREKFSRIITDFNNLIEVYGDDMAKKYWKVSAEKGTVIFGSALHRWGFVIPQLQKMGLTLHDIEKIYHNEEVSRLVKKIPVWEAVLAAVVTFLPDPKTAQEYRIPVIWEGDKDSEFGKMMRNCDPEAPVIIGISRVQKMKNWLVATGRVFSGTIHKGDMIRLIGQKTKVPVNRVSLFMGSRMENVDHIPAGNIVALTGLKKIHSGETCIASSIRDEFPPFESVKYVSEPVITVAIEPNMLKNLNKLLEILEEIQMEDPNLSVEISEDTGECLVSGMGPLHLEMVGKMIKERGVEVTVSNPTSVFRESVLDYGEIKGKTSPNSKNHISLSISRLSQKTVEALRNVSSSLIENEYKRISYLKSNTDLDLIEIKGVFSVDKHQNLVTLIGNKEQPISESILQQLSLIFKKICQHGPLAQEPLTELKIVIDSLQISSDQEESNYFELSTMCQQAVFEALEQANLVLLEPIYKLTITTPVEYIGTVSSLIVQHQGKIDTITQDQFRAYIHAHMSVRGSIEFSNEIRGETSGRVFWQAIFTDFEPVPEYKHNEIIQDLKFRKGLMF